MGSENRIGMVSSWKVRCGIASYTENLTRALAKHGVETYIVRLNRFGSKSSDYLEHLATRRIPKVPLLHIQHEYGLYEGREAVFYQALEMIHPEIKIATTVHGIGMKQQDEIIARFSDLVIVHNEYQKRLFEWPCVVIHHGVQLRKPMEAEKAKKLMNLKGEKVVGCFGFIAPHKGIEDLLYVASKIRNVKFLIAGGYHVEAETGYMTKLKKTAPPNVIWTGYVEDAELPKVFGCMDLCIYPSRFISESGALLTIIGFGKALIARNLPPNREKPVMLFKTKEDLVDCVRQVLDDEELRMKLEEGSKRYAKANSWMKIAEQHIKHYKKLLQT